MDIRIKSARNEFEIWLVQTIETMLTQHEVLLLNRFKIINLRLNSEFESANFTITLNERFFSDELRNISHASFELGLLEWIISTWLDE